MAEERIPITYYIDPKSGEVHRKKGKGDEILEDRVVAHYDAEKRVLTFKTLSALRSFKTGVVTFLAENELLVRSFQRGDMEPDPEPTKAIPPRPKKTKLEGDKTPEVVDWYFKYKPNEFATRYGVLGRYTGTVLVLKPKWEPRPIDGLMEYRGEQKWELEVRNVIVATRKTHLTYTPEECSDWDEEEAEDGVMLVNEEAERGAITGSRKGSKEDDE